MDELSLLTKSYLTVSVHGHVPPRKQSSGIVIQEPRYLKEYPLTRQERSLERRSYRCSSARRQTAKSCSQDSLGNDDPSG